MSPPERQPLRIVDLAEHETLVPALARGFEAEWKPYYGADGPGDAERDLRACLRSERLPTCLVALDRSGDLLGSVCLRREWSFGPGREPWVSALLVMPSHRGRGVGSELVAATEAEARSHGYRRLHAATASATGILLARGWTPVDSVVTLQGRVRVFAVDLAR